MITNFLEFLLTVTRRSDFSHRTVFLIVSYSSQSVMSSIYTERSMSFSRRNTNYLQMLSFCVLDAFCFVAVSFFLCQTVLSPVSLLRYFHIASVSATESRCRWFRHVRSPDSRQSMTVCPASVHCPFQADIRSKRSVEFMQRIRCQHIWSFQSLWPCIWLSRFSVALTWWQKLP